MIKVVILFVVGIFISSLLNRNVNAAGVMLVSNTLFVTSMCFILVALMQFVSNVGLFNGVTFGTKSLVKIIKRKFEGSEKEKEEYIKYIESKKKFSDTAKLLIIGAALTLCSVLVSSV